MRYPLRLAVTAILIAVCAIPAAAAHQATAQSGSCSDSWGADGHNAPWYVGSNQSLPGNTVDISCPTSGTAWNVTYQVGKIVNGTVFFPIDITRSGNGDASWSINTSPVGCNSGAPYYTHVHNHVTGGDIYKPSSKGIAIC